MKWGVHIFYEICFFLNVIFKESKYTKYDVIWKEVCILQAIGKELLDHKYLLQTELKWRNRDF